MKLLYILIYTDKWNLTISKFQHTKILSMYIEIIQFRSYMLALILLLFTLDSKSGHWVVVLLAIVGTVLVTATVVRPVLALSVLAPAAPARIGCLCGHWHVLGGWLVRGW